MNVSSKIFSFRNSNAIYAKYYILMGEPSLYYIRLIFTSQILLNIGVEQSLIDAKCHLMTSVPTLAVFWPFHQNNYGNHWHVYVHCQYLDHRLILFQNSDFGCKCCIAEKKSFFIYFFTHIHINNILHSYISLCMDSLFLSTLFSRLE